MNTGDRIVYGVIMEAVFEQADVSSKEWMAAVSEAHDWWVAVCRLAIFDRWRCASVLDPDGPRVTFRLS